MEASANAGKSAFSAFRLAAVTLVSLALALYTLGFDRRQIARFDAMSPSDYLAYEHHLHSNSIVAIFLTILIMGLWYLGAVEGVTAVLRLLARSK